MIIKTVKVEQCTVCDGKRRLIAEALNFGDTNRARELENELATHQAQEHGVNAAGLFPGQIVRVGA